MPMMTMDAEHLCVPAAPLDLRTTNRECGSAECGIPDCKGRAGDARVRIPPAPPTSSGTHSVERFCPPVRDSLPGAENNASRKRPADKSSLRLPFRKRPIPVEPETQNRPPTPPQRGHRGSPATDQDFPSWERLAGRAAVESRIISTPATRRNDEEEAHSPDGYPVRFLHTFDDYDVYPVYRVLPVPDQSHPLAHQTENLLVGISLATRQDEDGDTALHIAVVQGKLAIVHKLIQLLLLAHRSLDIYNNLRQTPLHLAVITQQTNMVEALLREGADPAALDRNGKTAIHLCCEYHQCDCLSVLLSCSSSSPCLEIRNYEGLSVLHLAVLRGHKDLARMLLDAGANINAMDVKSGQSPLMHAVENNNPDMVHFLIENGCDVNSQSYSGNTALHSACGRGQVETARLLLKSGADSSLKNYHNDTPVMVASTKKITDVLRGRASNQMRDQDRQCVSVSPHGSSFTKNGSASPSHCCGCSPAAASHTLQHRASHSPKTPSTPVFPFR